MLAQHRALSIVERRSGRVSDSLGSRRWRWTWRAGDLCPLRQLGALFGSTGCTGTRCLAGMLDG
jgi:hypothetical protein